MCVQNLIFYKYMFIDCMKKNNNTLFINKNKESELNRSNSPTQN